MQTNPTPHAPQRRSLSGTFAVGGLAVVAAAVLAACQPALPDAKAAPATASEAPSVPVARVRSVVSAAGASQVARVEAAQRVELQARVSGPIDAVLFREGDLVRAGQPLFQIDPRPHDAALARALAEVQLARARETLTAAEAERARQLHADRAIAVEEVERRVAAHAEAQARRAGAEAALQTAQLERDFTLVRAPIDGRIGRALVTAGNFVAAEALARKRFAAGGADLLELLDAQRSAQQAEIGLAAAVTTQQQQVVALQRALGARFLPADATETTTLLAATGGIQDRREGRADP